MTATTSDRPGEMTEPILVLNSGSSSIKYRLFSPSLEVLATGLIERIGESVGRTVHQVSGTTDAEVTDAPVADHAAGFAGIVDALARAGVANDGFGAIGHRVVHGGPVFHEASVVDDAVIEAIRDQIPLAPLHNPANLTGIEVATQLAAEVPQVAVFDTAFHATLPPAAYRYALPDELRRAYGVRRYGFHGTSHAYVAGRAAEFLQRPLDGLALVTLHLGNGASACAIDGGVSVETSMGLTPLEGLVMGTRSGDVDPAVIFHLMRQADMDAAEVEQLLNREGGLKGMCGDNDLRAVEERAAGGDEAAVDALDVYTHRIRRYLGGYAAVLGRLDAVVFTAGVGENSDEVRARVCHNLSVLGISVDDSSNRGARPNADEPVVAIHADNSDVAVLVVATDEEREIAAQTVAAIAAARGA